MASFDRRLCKGPLNGPSATGKHCPEGWKLYPFPGPQMQTVTESGSAEASYYTWVDQFDTLGLGKDVPIATGKHCPEGWTLSVLPGPQVRDVADPGSVESSYYTWVDQFDTSGLGRNVPIATGNMNDALHALVNGKFVNLRVPYPIGFYTKWVEGRIDDPDAGWKGRGLWATYSTRAMFHLEGGKENRPKVVKFQVRPDPLAR